ncbi:MAG TPA: peptidoglycan DD-metalloendopeptidase family protein, partial [Anaerolineae bacterium]|nr:peptidoglycan DD-metalloendopeptidase family protein [Anaerolineae bacterium]HQH40046.1 peptidoglycan DD-metalloendopeptidase family protein [Anaerolineae bacterium]
MNDRTRRHLLRFVFVMLCGLTATATLATPASSRSAAPQQATAFLSAPYYGSTWLSSIFDHDVRPNHILAFTGAAAHENNCPCQPLPPEPPPNPNCSRPNFPSAYLSCDIRRYLYYDGHNGIDYVLRYAYVRAAAPGTVARANWADPNHQVSYGLHVRIDHDLNGDRITDYQTIYGHMSVLQVRQNDEIPAGADEFARIIGISGNTGDSTGPHLHFEVRNAAGTPVDPYGPDRNPDHKLWIERPPIAPHVIYTSGDRPLTAPPIDESEPGAFTVDDGDAGFVENPAGCWTVDTTLGWTGDHRWRNVPLGDPGNCTATWNFPGTPGRYNVFVYVPNNHATTDAAQYTIRHTESPDRPWSKQSALARVNQLAYPNTYHLSSWVYVGTYYFNNQYGTDYVRLEAQPLDPIADTMVAADAVRFAPVVYRTYLPLV